MNELKLFDPLVAEITQYVSPAKALVVTDAFTQSQAVETGKKIAALRKRVDEKRKELVKPLNDRVDIINDFAKKIGGPIVETETHLKKQIGAFEDLKRKEREAEIERVRKEQEAEEKRKQAEIAKATKNLDSDIEKITVAVQIGAEFKETSKALRAEEKEIQSTAMKGAKQVWKFEITEEAQVPVAYMTIDEKKIREAVRAGVRDIPGVRIFQETQVSFGQTTAVSAAAQRGAFFGGGQ
jgi:DNA repair exonuclease SbcCD ATPase subunit